METAPSTLVSLLLVLFLLSSPAAMARPVVDELTPDVLLPSPAAAPSALAPGADVHASDYDVYIVFVSRAGYIDSVDYDVRLLASVVGRLVVSCVASNISASTVHSIHPSLR